MSNHNHHVAVRLGIRCPSCCCNLAQHWRRALAKCINPRCFLNGEWRKVGT